MKQFTLTFIAGLWLLATSAFSTDIPAGTVNTSTWTAAGSPYNVLGDILIAEGNTLTIEPGVEVIVSNNNKITVEGRILSIGSTTSGIVFKAANNDPGWSGLKIKPVASSDTSKLIHTQIAYSNDHGLYFNSSKVIVNHCEIHHNKGGAGGGIYTAGCDARISNSSIHHNTATNNHGGGIFSNQGNLFLYNNLIYENTADYTGKYGGGLYTYKCSSVRLTNNNLINNHAANGGWQAAFQNGTIRLNNNVIWENDWTARDKSLFLYCGTYYFDYNAMHYGIDDGSSPVNPLTIHRGVTVTLTSSNDGSSGPNFTDPENGDFSLMAASPLANRGDTAGLLNYIDAYDYVGNSRIRNGFIDIGAFESDIRSYFVMTYAGENGFLSGNSSQFINEGFDASSVRAIPNTGYHFLKWVDSEGNLVTSENPVGITSVNSDTSLTALSEVNTYSISFSAGENGTVSGETAQTIAFGSDAQPIEAVADFGYHFKEWQGTTGNVLSTDNPLIVSKVSADSSLTAIFEINSYAVSFNAGENGSLSGQTSQTVQHGYGSAAVEAIADPDYYFVEWQTLSGEPVSTDNPLTVTNVQSDTSLVAIFDEYILYTLEFSAGEHGSISGSANQSVLKGTDAEQVEAIAETNYRFVEWQTPSGMSVSSDNPLTVTNVQSDSSLIAFFEEYILFTIEFTAGENGYVSGTTTQSVLKGTDTEQVEAVADANYQFVEWQNNLGESITSENPLIVENVLSDSLLIAKFEAIVNGLSEKKLHGISIYPNPAQERITICSAQNVNAELHRANGQVVRNDITIMAGYTTEIDLGDLNAGIYLLVIHTQSGTQIRKMVVRE